MGTLHHIAGVLPLVMLASIGELYYLSVNMETNSFLHGLTESVMNFYFVSGQIQT